MIRCLLVLILSFSSSVFAADFQVGTAPGWSLLKQDGSSQIYSKGQGRLRQVVVLRSFESLTPMAERRQAFEKNLPQVHLAKERYLNKWGLGSYRIFSARFFKSQRPALEIEAQMSLSNHKVTKITERQYFSDNKVYQVIHLNHSARALTSSQRTELFKNFQPKFNGRSPASEVVQGDDLHLEGQDTEAHQWSADQIRLTQNETASCDHIPADKRSTSNSDQTMDQLLSLSGGCLQGVWGSIESTLTGIGDMIGGAWNYTVDGAYREQVNATAGLVMGEFWNDPGAFSQRVLGEVYNLLMSTMGDFPCYNFQIQSQMVCGALTYIIPSGLLLKVLTRAKLTRAELNALTLEARKRQVLSSPAPTPVPRSPLAWAPNSQALAQPLRADVARKHSYEATLALRSSDPAQQAEALRVLKELKYESVPVRAGGEITQEMSTITQLSQYVVNSPNAQMRLEATEALIAYSRHNGGGPGTGTQLHTLDALDKARNANIPAPVRSLLDAAIEELR